jgi:two-component system NarL family sensor kinase
MAKAMGNLSGAFDNQNRTDSAIAYILGSARLFEELGDTARFATCYNKVSFFYNKIGLYPKAYEYAIMTNNLAKKIHNNMLISTSYMNIARTFQYGNEKAKCILYCDSAAQLLKDVTALYEKSAGYQNISSMLYNAKSMDGANRYADSCLKYAAMMGNNKVSQACYSVKGRALLAKGELNQAGIYLDMALPLALEEKEWRHLNEVYAAKSQLEFARGNFKTAFEFHELSVTYKDSLFNENVTSAVAELNAKYQLEKKENEVHQLEKEKEVESLQASSQKRQKYFFIGIAILSIATILLLLLNVKRRNTINAQHEAIQSQRINDLEKEKQLIAMDALIKGEENERSRMAKDLHDGLGSLLSGVKLSLSSMKGNVLISEEHARIFSSSLNQLDNAMNEMRRVAHNMMPESLIKFGLTQAIQNICDVLNESGKIIVRFETHHISERLSSDQEITLYRITQELVNNALKHAEAKNIFIQMSKHENNVTLEIEDDGRGFEVTNIETSNGSGYANLKHRVNYLRGTMNLQSNPGKGTSVIIEFPIK